MPKKKKEQKTRAEILDFVAGDIKDAKRISDIEEERFVPTLITSFNRAIGIGGLPLRRLILVHGRNSSGKSSFALVLAESMRLNGHIPIVFDTECSAEKKWYELLSGGGDDTIFKMPQTMNEMIGDVNDLVANLKNLRKENSDYNNISICFVIDTITKLLPKDLFKKIEKDGVDKAYPIQALFTSIWMKYIIPVLYRTNSSAIIVLQDRKNMNKKTPFDADDKPTGGEALQYDNSIRIHFEQPAMIKSSDKTKILAWKNTFIIEKNKVDGVSKSKGQFYTGTGQGYIPKGLDCVTEAIEEMKYREWCKRTGNTIKIAFEDYELKLDGGWKTLFQYYSENKDEFNQVVNLLNKDAMRVDE